MGKFNLLDESWLSVVLDETGTTKEVSLREVFKNAHLYKDLAGDTKTQDFAVLRVLLAVLHTVFSRFDAHGNVYGCLEVDDRLIQVAEIDEEDIEEHTEDLYDTWFTLWEKQQFPEIVATYLEKWHDRFNLFDEEYPFFQVRKQDINADKISRPKGSLIYGKNINRLISESGNKTALFSPKHKASKDNLTSAEIARWLITFQGYTGLSDKVIFGKQKYKPSKGWLFDLGAVYFAGRNLFETLMLNFALVYHEYDNAYHIQKPCWEYNAGEIIASCFDSNHIDNLAGLYTAWSRGIYIEADIDVDSPFLCYIVKLPDINHADNFLEPMTIWKYNDNGENKNKYTPRKHQQNKAMWRSFGLITGWDAMRQGNEYRKPGLIEWLFDIKNISEQSRKKLKDRSTALCIISMQDDGNATSWVPTDEIHDYLVINDFVLTDLKEDGWIVRLNEVIEETKKVIGFIYKKYIADIKEIRNISSDLFISQKVEEVYFAIDNPFRTWLAGIQPYDEKEKKIMEWKTILKELVQNQARKMFYNAAPRDYMGIIVGEDVKNIATAYNIFSYRLDRELKPEGGDHAN